MKKIFLILSLCVFSEVQAQSDRWQQKASYQMDVDVDVTKNQFKGKQKLVYTNNSPDVLDKAFYHLYFNAFQPNSMMDVRSRTIQDPDPRVRDRIFNLKPEEIGYQKIISLKQDGQPVKFEVVGTILEVKLAKAIQPKGQSVFEMEFESQIPLQIRRTGRDNKEGIRYSAAQWYPKMAEYDYMGWHAHPYVGREFYGIWGDFDVKLTIDASYVVAATGYLQNPQEVGFGYEDKKKPFKKTTAPKLTWSFKAPNVHDFMWAADPDFQHTTAQVEGTTLHFFYQKDVEANWSKLPEYMAKSFQIMNKTFGKYPYQQFSFIQGGDGGMEYPMATLILGNGNLEGLVGVSVHESIHNWYYGVLATNESLFPWMDEGFTSYAEDFVMDKLFNVNAQNPFSDQYRGYESIVKNSVQEPLSQHADHFKSNRTYSISSYSKGAVFLHQLSYVIGKEAFDKGMLLYFDTWKFKHPNALDFIRIMEKTSGLELDWYLEYWINTTKTIDYSIKNITADNGNTQVVLERIGEMIMPIDLVVTLKNGQKERYYIPLDLMRGEKKEEAADTKIILLEDWGWTYPEYTFKLPYGLENVAKLEIDPTGRMADINKANNSYPYLPQEKPRPNVSVVGKTK